MKVFISYSHHDGAAAKSLDQAFRNHGWEVGIDSNILAGERWRPEVAASIASSDYFLALISDASGRSTECKREWRHALNLQSRKSTPSFVPLRLHKSRLPRALESRFQFIDYSHKQTPDLIRQLEERTENSIRGFWGEAVFNRPIRLVHALRTLTNGKWRTFARPPKGARPKGVNHWLAVQDIRAAVHLTNALSRLKGNSVDAGVDVVFDADFKLPTEDHCAISLGLGFNALTVHFAKMFRNQLFSIQYRPPRGHRWKSDWFSIGDQDVQPPRGHDDALIARIVMPQRKGARVVHFICAGSTAQGTAAAGYFLAERWREIASLYSEHDLDLNAHSVAVAIWHQRSRDSHNEHDTTGELARHEGRVLHSKAQHPGIL